MKTYQTDFPRTEKKKSFVFTAVSPLLADPPFFVMSAPLQEATFGVQFEYCPIHGQDLPCDLYFTRSASCNLRFAIFTVACISRQK